MWRRLADVLLRRAALEDERTSKARELVRLEREMIEVNDELRQAVKGAHDRLASYRRVRIGR